MIKSYIFFISYFICPFTILAQIESGVIKGVVKDQNNNSVPGIEILIKPLNFSTKTNNLGEFVFNKISEGNYTLVIVNDSYEVRQQKIKVEKGKNTLINLRLEKVKNPANQLEALTIVKKSRATIIREEAYAVEVVESEKFKNSSTNVNDILGKVSGVNLRQSGGLGSEFSLSINGLSNNQIRVFLNGIPMDYFGSSLSLNNFSPNLIDRIEVYKGVVPVHLSADALGGAINVITDTNTSNYTDISYSLGSYNTDIISLNSQYRDKNSGFTTRLKSFYNYSDNNYKIPVKLINFETGRQDEKETIVERFHSGYRSRMVWGELGFTKTKFADNIMAGIMYSDNRKEIQQPDFLNGEPKIPYGAVSNKESKIITNFSFRKDNLLNTKLSLNAYAVGIFAKNEAIDTVAAKYDWFGRKTLRANNVGGEIDNRKTLLKLDTKNYLSRINTEYEINKNLNFTLNYALNHLNLQGEDPFKKQNNTQFGETSKVNKNVLASSFTSKLLDSKLKSTVFSKLYRYKINTTETDYNGDQNSPFEENKDYLGLGVASTFKLDKIQFKASYERATRFPETIEIFGNGLNVHPSPTISPERSDNFNLGLYFKNLTKKNKITASVNGFVRNTKDLIIPVRQGIIVIHDNLGKAIARGVDFNFGISPLKNVFFDINGTYMHKVDDEKYADGLESITYKERIPNEPYLFGNASLFYTKKDMFNKKDALSVVLAQNYVHNFFYNWENIGNQNIPEVPKQFSSDIEFVYSESKQKFSASVSIRNLFDSDLYDNFNQKKPGRNFNIKLRYFIN